MFGGDLLIAIINCVFQHAWLLLQTAPYSYLPVLHPSVTCMLLHILLLTVHEWSFFHCIGFVPSPAIEITAYWLVCKP